MQCQVYIFIAFVQLIRLKHSYEKQCLGTFIFSNDSECGTKWIRNVHRHYNIYITI